MISPFVATLDEETADKISAWVQDGGVWIVGPMSDIFDENMSRFIYSPYGMLEKIAGVYTTDCNPVGNEITSATWTNGKYTGAQLPLSDCYDSYALCDGTESIAKYEDREEFVITRRKLGKRQNSTCWQRDRWGRFTETTGKRSRRCTFGRSER